MNFELAINKLKQGKKVRRPCWEEDSYWELGIDEKICWKDGETAHIHLNQINAKDWEVHENEEDKIVGIILKLVKSSKAITKKEKDFFEKWHLKESKDCKNGI